jgi:cytochrome P450
MPNDMSDKGASHLTEVWQAVVADLSARRYGAATPQLALASSSAAGVVRTHDGVEVTSKALLMATLLDVAENESVCGYAKRFNTSFGQIYLGMDKGPEYDSQATLVNKAIGELTESESFNLALNETRKALSTLNDPAAFNIQDVSDQVLAGVCTAWFDLPDGDTMQAGGFQLLLSLVAKARCPGDFSLPSGYVFTPNPDFLFVLYGERLGHILKDAALEFVAKRRAPANPPVGVLSKAIFAAFPKSPEQDDVLARTVVGVMMGFLPTTSGNLVAAVTGWQKDGTYASLKRQFANGAEPDLYLRACAVLLPPLIQAMQLNPTPPAVWRTALRDHVVGGCPVKKGEKVVLSIVSATRGDLAAKTEDVFPVFGGDRRQTPHPTHACPGYAAAIGVLLGVLAGLMIPDAGAHPPSAY